MIEAMGLTMVYGPVVAAKDISFTVRPGEIMGLLGPNGAGKSTVLKILATQIVPTAGEARISGVDVLKDPQGARANLGFLPENAPLYDQMEVGEYLSFVAEARVSPERRPGRIAWVKERCGLEEVWFTPIAELSKGYRQRVGLAQALIHDPPCLILDEPTSGLDPLQIVEIRRLIRELSAEKAIIFSTHILQEVKALADWVSIINEGQLVAQGKLSELAREASEETVLLVKTDRPFRKLFELGGLKVEDLGQKEGSYLYRVSFSGDKEGLITQAACAEGVSLLSLERESEDLERIFLSLIARKEEAHGRS